jgi:hypothetical protein
VVDAKQIRRRILVRLLSAPLTLLPFALGVTALAGSWALDLSPGAGLFAGIAGLVVAGGNFFSQLVTRGDRYAREEVERVRFDAHIAQERQLDDLDRRLRTDNDPRTETALRDLRALEKAFHELSGARDKVNHETSIDIVAGVEQLVDRCVASLEESLRLWHMARGLNSAAARKPILLHREQIIVEVGRSIEQLGKILAEMQDLGASTQTPAELARVRAELDQSLELARTVDERMKEFSAQLGRPELE